MVMSSSCTSIKHSPSASYACHGFEMGGEVDIRALDGFPGMTIVSVAKHGPSMM